MTVPAAIYPHIANLVTLGFPPILADHIAGEGGWIQVNEKWTYGGSGPNYYYIIVPKEAGDRFWRGVRIRLTQSGTTKYFIVQKAGKLVTGSYLWVSGDTLTNSTISDIWMSFVPEPILFPSSFSFTPTWKATTTDPTIGDGSLTGRWWAVGYATFFEINLIIGSTTTLGSGNWYFNDIPLTSSVIEHATTSGILKHGSSVYSLQSYDNGAGGISYNRPAYGSPLNWVSSTLPGWSTGDTLNFNGIVLCT